MCQDSEYHTVLNMQGVTQGKGGGSFVELGHLDKDFLKKTKKRGPAEKHFGIFSPGYS